MIKMLKLLQYAGLYSGLIIPFCPRALGDSSISIVSNQPYKEQRICAQHCLWHFGFTNDLSSFLGCTSPWVNDCYCRADLASMVTSFLASCVDEGCSQKTEDVKQALSVYNGYCASNMPAINAANPTATDNTPTATIRVVTTVVSSSNMISNEASQASSEYLRGIILIETTLCLLLLSLL